MQIHRVLHTIRTPGPHVEEECEQRAPAAQLPVGTSAVAHDGASSSLATSSPPASFGALSVEELQALAARRKTAITAARREKWRGMRNP